MHHARHVVGRVLTLVPPVEQEDTTPLDNAFVLNLYNSRLILPNFKPATLLVHTVIHQGQMGALDVLYLLP